MDTSRLGGISRRLFGVVIGVVVDNQDPEAFYRVKCKLPWIRSADAGDDEDFLTAWCRIASPMAGKGRGFYTLPEVEDEVLIAFEHGDPRRPIIVGQLWNKVDTAPVGDSAPAATTDPMGNDLGIATYLKDNKSLGGKNQARFFHSRNGSSLIFVDEDGKEKIIIKTAKGACFFFDDEQETLGCYDSSGEEYLYLDHKNKKITLESKNGDIDVFCKNGTFTLEAKEIVTKASANSKHEAGSNYEFKAGSEVKGTASSNMTYKGAKINLN